MGIDFVKDRSVGFKSIRVSDKPEGGKKLTTWEKAEGRYRQQGMSEKEIGKYKKAWMKRKQDKPEEELSQPTVGMLGTGAASQAGSALKKRKSQLEKLAAELDGKEF